jgi:hypothetical protein
VRDQHATAAYARRVNNLDDEIGKWLAYKIAPRSPGKLAKAFREALLEATYWHHVFSCADKEKFDLLLEIRAKVLRYPVDRRVPGWATIESMQEFALEWQEPPWPLPTVRVPYDAAEFHRELADEVCALLQVAYV